MFTSGGVTVNAALVGGLDLPRGIAISGSNIFVTQKDTGTVSLYSDSGTTLNPSLITNLNRPAGIAVSGSTLFVVNNGSGSAAANGSIGAYTTSGTTINSALVSGLSNPKSVAVSGSYIYIAVAGAGLNSGYVAKYTTSGELVNASLISGLVDPKGIAIVGDSIFVSNSNTKISKYTIGGELVSSTLVTGLQNAYGLAAVGSDLYVTNQASGRIGKYTTSGATINASLITGLVAPQGLSLSQVPISAGGTYYTNNVGNTVLADFAGGILAGAADATTINGNFNVGAVVGNTIDANGYDLVFSGNLSGPGGLQFTDTSGLGKLIRLTGANSYTGGTIVSAGTLVGTTSSLQGSITNNATVIFDQVANGTYAGSMSGTGRLVKTGAGTVVLSGANTYTGPTSILSGKLSINGSVSSDVTVGGSGTLGGSGTINGNALVNGALAPGNSIGTLTIAGNLTATAGSTYQVELNSAAQNDRTNVSGTAILSGGIVMVSPQPGVYSLRNSYTILTATGGVAGAYAGATTGLPFLQASLGYDANNVYLSTVPGGFAATAATPLQAAVGAALDAGVAGASGDFASVLSALAYNTGTAAQGQAALQALSGNNYAGFSSFMAQGAALFMNNFVGVAGSQSRGRVAIAEACDVACDSGPPRPAWGAWGGALGGLGSIGGQAPVGAVTYNAGGFAAGLDRALSDSFRLGVTAGYSAGNQWVSGFAGQGRTDTVLAGLYGNWAQGPAYVDGLVGYAYSWNQMWRPILLPGLGPRTALGQTGANQFFGQLEGGWRFELGTPAGAWVTPFARLQAYTGTQNGFTETGASSLDLSVTAQTTNSLRSVLGATVGSAFDFGWREKLALQLRLGWSHEYADTARPVTAALAGSPASPFTTFGIAPSRDGALLGFGATTAIADATSVYLRYEGMVAGQDSTHAFTAGVRMTW